MKKNNDLINEFQALDPKSMNMDKIKEVKTKYKSLFAKAIIAKVEKAQAKKDTTANQAKPTKELKAVKNSFKYPFILHIAGRNIETDYIFEPGKEYTGEQIRLAMLEHQYYDFAGTVTFEFLEKENVLLPIFQQHKKG